MESRGASGCRDRMNGVERDLTGSPNEASSCFRRAACRVRLAALRCLAWAAR